MKTNSPKGEKPEDYTLSSRGFATNNPPLTLGRRRLDLSSLPSPAQTYQRVVSGF